MKQKKLKIGLLSDSHRKTELHQEVINHLLACGANYLLHAGDLEIKEHLDILETSGVPYICVYGNNDTLLIPLYGKYYIYREPHYFKIEELKFKMMHYPYYLNGDVDVVIYGHTHRFEVSMNGEILFINPGEVCARDTGVVSCVMLEISDSGGYEVIHYFREECHSEWQIDRVEF